MSARPSPCVVVPALALAAALLAGACGGGSGDAEATGGSGGTGATTGSTGPAAVPGAELVGRWAHYDIVAYQDPMMKTQIISYGFTDFAVEDGRLVESEEFCHADQASDLPIQTSISDEATQAITPVSTPVEVSGEPGAWRVQRPATPTPVGIRLDDPANEPLPTDPDDPRIVDDDGDGSPGITVTVSANGNEIGKLFLARREIFAYDLVQDGPDSMRGSITDSSEQLVVGATSEALLSTKAQWDQVDDVARSPIVLVRVGDDWGCERLMAERATLFPPDPPIDW